MVRRAGFGSENRRRQLIERKLIALPAVIDGFVVQTIARRRSQLVHGFVHIGTVGRVM